MVEQNSSQTKKRTCRNFRQVEENKFPKTACIIGLFWGMLCLVTRFFLQSHYCRYIRRSQVSISGVIKDCVLLDSFKTAIQLLPLVVYCLHRGEDHICTGIVEHLWVKRPCICSYGKEPGCHSGGYS